MVKRSVYKKICVLLTVLSIAFAVFANFNIDNAVYAVNNIEYEYSNVLDDLQKDSNFSTEYYPEKVADYSLQVIQIAESVDRKLFIYVYQPSGQKKDLKACSINISTTINDQISYYNYKLQFCNSSGVFYKYVVEDFIVLDLSTRYYSITSIYRPFDESIDKGADFDNTITEVDYDVSKQYCFSTINGKPYVSVVDIETIDITEKFVGYVRYLGGFKLFTSGACDSHFVAFNTDKPIDKLIEADLCYSTQEYSWTYTPYSQGFETFGEKSENKYAYLDDEQKGYYHDGGWFVSTYVWDRIETVEQFISENNLTQNVYSGAIFDVSVGTQLTETAISALKGKKWVLLFLETEYIQRNNPGAPGHSSTFVGDVTILRLKFETDGITYNLGTIDNKQTGSREPSNSTSTSIKIKDDFSKIFALILGILLLILLLVVFAPILPYILQGIVWVVMLPVKAVVGLYNGAKDLTNKKKRK